MSNYTVLIDAGHGGIDSNGEYTTIPVKMANGELETKSFIHSDGTVHYEGVTNRAISNKVIELLKKNNIDFKKCYDEILDTPMRNRVEVADRAYAQNKKTYFLSIHSDKLPEGSHGRASGISVWTSKGQTTSDKLAEIFFMTGEKRLNYMKWRKDKSDGDADMEADFYVLRKTDCPAILLEIGFYDNFTDSQWLRSEKGQQEVAEWIMESVLNIEKLKPF